MLTNLWRNLKARSDSLTGRRPEWNQEFFFEVSTEIDLGVEIEIWEKGFLWDRTLGMIMMPYASIRFANDEGPGSWLNLEQQVTRELTNHRIQMDIRFETGNDLTLEEVLFVQNSFHSNWRVKALDQLQFDDGANSDDSQLLGSIIDFIHYESSWLAIDS